MRKRLLEALAKAADVRVPMLERPLNDLVDDLDNVRLPVARKGQLLEAVALHLVRLMGLRFKGRRVRGAETGGAEVDLIADRLNGKFARYQFQCKHRGTVDAQHVDREVGVANKLNSNVIVMVTTGKVTQGARQSADQHMRRSSISIIFIDGVALRRVRQREGEIVGILEREFERVRTIKNLARLGEL